MAIATVAVKVGALGLSLAVHAAVVALAVWVAPARPAADTKETLFWVSVVREPQAQAIVPVERAAPPKPRVRAPAAPVSPQHYRPTAAPAVSAPPAAAAPANARAATLASPSDLRLRSRRTPRYPQAARLRGAEGVTLLRVRVEESGRVGDVRVERSAGDAELDRAARQAVRVWRFEPLRNLRDAEGLWVLIPVEFRLY